MAARVDKVDATNVRMPDRLQGIKSVEVRSSGNVKLFLALKGMAVA